MVVFNFLMIYPLWNINVTKIIVKYALLFMRSSSLKDNSIFYSLMFYSKFAAIFRQPLSLYKNLSDGLKPSEKNQ